MSFPERCEQMSIHPRLHTDKPKKQLYQCSIWLMNQQAYLLWEHEWFKSCIIVKSLFCAGRNFLKASLMTLNPADLPPLKWPSTPQDLAELRGWLWLAFQVRAWWLLPLLLPGHANSYNRHSYHWIGCLTLSQGHRSRVICGLSRQSLLLNGNGCVMPRENLIQVYVY